MRSRPLPLLTRRHVLQAGLVAAATTALARTTPARAAAATPLTKAIPSTGEHIPIIGIGTNSFRLASLESLRPLLKRFAELGARVIDTAALYGDSESVIGQALADLGLRKQMFIATKLMGGPMPMMGPPPAGAPPAGGPPVGMGPQLYGAESFEHSLNVLQTDHVDLLQVHGMNDIEELMPLLIDWKKAGRIRYIGVTTSIAAGSPAHDRVHEAVPARFRAGRLLDRQPRRRGHDPATGAGAQDRRARQRPARWPGAGESASSISRPLPPWATDFGIGSWPQFMLKYVASHPAVTCAIPGSTQLEHMEDNQKAAFGTLPDAATRRRMESTGTKAEEVPMTCTLRSAALRHCSHSAGCVPAGRAVRRRVACRWGPAACQAVVRR